MPSLFPLFMGTENSTHAIIEVVSFRSLNIENQSRVVSVTATVGDFSGSEKDSSIQSRTLFVGEQMREITVVEQLRVVHIIFETRTICVEG